MRVAILKPVQVFIGLWFVLFAGTMAQASCVEKRVFDQINQIIQRTVFDGLPISLSERHALTVALNRLQPDSVAPLLKQSSLSIYAPFLDDLLKDIDALGRQGNAKTIGIGAMDMRLGAQIFDELCQPEAEIVARFDSSAQSRQLGLITFSFESAFRLGSSPDIRSYFNLSLVFFVLLGLISLVVFSWKAYVIVDTFLANRKARLIRAAADVLNEAAKVQILQTANKKPPP
ncbi:MAG: hypothetical protein WBC85_04035 [Planktotalea sp.]|uniref:hypothetical protein n=1 Tax=Planktotalea sp. TaxID=2029877 RepID=UPI003C77E5AA